ncbi:DUF2326 domain-containing protein [Hungatella hathewayi]|uniref:DUF2326 domain-containing protein n=1 Tax=Hungatella hathewayi TaxID=154046 RepID=UPI003565A930
MYLKKLSANKESFHDLILSSNGINIILGSRSVEDKKKNDTVNGVGKTLSIKLIDYCLGCRSDAHKELKKLAGWEFCLTFDIDGKEHEILRSVDDEKFMFLDSKKKTIGQVKDFLEAECFHCVEDLSNISFRGLISRYLRIPKEGYLDWKKYKKREDEHISLLLNSFLLGLDVSLIISKIKIKEEINKIENSRKLLKNDTEIKNAMTGSDLRISIGNLEKEIRDLEARMEGFQISEGYNEIKADIEKCTRDKNDLINQIAKYENIIKSINKNLELKVDVTAEKVKNLYEEANVIFPENMLKSMQEICDFHEKLLDGRKARLIKDKKQYQSEIRKVKKNLARLDQIINNDMEFIKDKVSTTEYEHLQSRLTELKVSLAKMQQYDTVIKQLEIKKANYQADLAKDNIEAIAYINAIEEYKKGLDNQFSQFVDYIYGERKYSGIDIVNNPGDNKQRFDINVEIQDDGSGGIGNVKIFCMDMLIWDKGKNNKVQFLYHDGSLFAETDPRQCYRMLKIANDICEKGEKQYIINLNYDMFDNIISVAKELDDEAFANTLNNSIRLKLYDRSPEDKLLGIQIK